MKKALVIILVLSLVMGAFAAEPVADLNLVDFNGSAATTFGVNLNNGDTGFKNEANVTLKLNFLAESTKSTTGDGIWGELAIKLDGDLRFLVDDKASGTLPAIDSPELIIDVAQIHIYDFYVGIKSGDLKYGGDFYYPNALNYKDEDDDGTGTVRNRSNGIAGYDQGLVLGYANDFFKVEASLRTQPGSKTVDDYESVTVEYANKPNGPMTSVTANGIVGEANGWKEIRGESDIKYLAESLPVAAAGVVPYEVGNNQTGGAYHDKKSDKWYVWGTYYRVVQDNSNGDYWSGSYAMGVYVEAKPITDLRIGAGMAFGITDTKDGGGPGGTFGDISAFAGAEYRVNIGEKFLIQPVLTYNLYHDASEERADSKAETITTNKVGLGLRFGWGGSSDSDSLIWDFYGEDVYYNVADEGDNDLLPGVSIFTAFDLVKDATNPGINNAGYFEKEYSAMEKDFPIMVTFYSGEILSGLKAYAYFYANVGKEASSVASGSFLSGDVASHALKDGLQFALAASYAIPAGDVTITPAVGMLYRMAKLVDEDDDKNVVTASSFMPEVKVDIAGLLPNTTFTVAWADASFSKIKTDISGVETESGGALKNGEMTFKVKIAL